jgi:hypothetical protein
MTTTTDKSTSYPYKPELSSSKPESNAALQQCHFIENAMLEFL